MAGLPEKSNSTSQSTDGHIYTAGAIAVDNSFNVPPAADLSAISINPIQQSFKGFPPLLGNASAFVPGLLPYVNHQPLNQRISVTIPEQGDGLLPTPTHLAQVPLAGAVGGLYHYVGAQQFPGLYGGAYGTLAEYAMPYASLANTIGGYGPASAITRAAIQSTLIPGAALPGVSLLGATLPAMPLLGAALSGATLPGAALPEVPLLGAALPGMQLPGAALPCMQLPGAALPGVPLPGGAMYGAAAIPIRKPAPPSSQLAIFNLPRDFKVGELLDIFSRFGEVCKVSVIPEKGGNVSYGFVSYTNLANAKKAFHEMNKNTVGCRKIRIEYQQPRDEN